MNTTAPHRMQDAINRVTMPVYDQRDETGRYLEDFTGKRLANVSDSYALVQNRDIIAPFVKRFGVDSVKRVCLYGASKYVHVAIATGRSFSFEYNGQGDRMDERLIIENSYNKSRSFRFMFGVYRSVCANGLYTGVSFAGIRRVHTGRIDAPGIVSQVLGAYEENVKAGKDSFDLWRDFQNCPMSLEEEYNLVREFKPFNEGDPDGPTGAVINDRAISVNRRIRATAGARIGRDESLDNQRNAWGLLNGLNWAIAQSIKGKSQLPRLISANVCAENYIAETITKKELGIR